MNTLHLKYALEVKKTGSFTQAASNLFMAQPNLSKAIKELEETLGIVIFERTPKGVVPTRKGSEFLIYAKKIIAQLEKIEALAIPEEINRQSFAISIPRGSYIARALTMFVGVLDVNKEIDVNVQESNAIDTINSIVDGQFRLGIIRFQSDYESYYTDFMEKRGLEYEIIWEFEYIVLLSKNNPLSEKDKIDGEDLVNCIEITHEDTIVPTLPVDRLQHSSLSQHARKRIYIYERSNQYDMLTNVPNTFMWASPAPGEMLSRYNLIQRKCNTENHKYKDMIVYNKGYKFSELDKKFIDLLFSSKNDVAFTKIY